MKRRYFIVLETEEVYDRHLGRDVEDGVMVGQGDPEPRATVYRSLAELTAEQGERK